MNLITCIFFPWCVYPNSIWVTFWGKYKNKKLYTISVGTCCRCWHAHAFLQKGLICGSFQFNNYETLMSTLEMSFPRLLWRNVQLILNTICCLNDSFVNSNKVKSMFSASIQKIYGFLVNQYMSICHILNKLNLC